MGKYQRNDIVRLGDSKFEEQKENLWFKDNAFMISEVGNNAMISLREVDEPISVSDLRPMPIGKNRAGNIYYDPVIAASIVSPGDEIPVYNRDYTYFMDSFEKVIEPDGTTLRQNVEKKSFKYVHEVQHWLRERHGSDDLKIHHKIITVAESQYRNLWKLRDDILEIGVSPYQFLYEMANMLYLRWMSFYDDSEAVRWKELEQIVGDELLDKYQQAIQHIDQQTQIYSAKVLNQAISVVSKCAKQENISELFDLMLQEHCMTKDGGSTQNYTPPVLTKLLVDLIKPEIGERWHDPASGYSGFLVEIDKYLRENNGDYRSLSKDEKVFQLTEALTGMEIQEEVGRIGLCNTRFHGLKSEVKVGNSLTRIDYQLYDGIVCEPPLPVFTLAGKMRTGNANKNRQTEFVELIVNSLSLQPRTRAALLLPENFLYKSSVDYRSARKRLFEDCYLHTILRLPQGIYPNSTISMCALFIQRQREIENNVLVYDMQSGKLKPEQLRDISVFKEFISVYHSRTTDERSRIVALDAIRNDDYRITFDKDNKKKEIVQETPMRYLVEANNVVRDIRILLSKIEKEVNG